jgi:amino acid adenylation domain-containing protein
MRPDEIQSVLASVAGDHGALVVPAETPDAWFAFFAGDETRGRELRAKLRDAAPDLATAVSWVSLERLPGIDRTPAPAALADAGRRAREAGSATLLEQIVMAAWQEALGVPPAGIDDDFFAAGGHSLLAADISARLSDVLGVDVPLTMVLDHPTVREQGAWLADAVGPARETAPPVPASTIRRVVAPGEPLDHEVLARAAELVAARHGVAADHGAVDLAGLSGAARRAAWLDAVASAEDVVRDGGAACATRLVAFDRAARPLVIAAFDGARLDDRSAAIWLDELCEACRALRDGREPLWSPRPRVTAAAGAARPDEDRGRWAGLRIAAAAASKLRALGRQQGATPLATAIAAIAVAIARRTGRARVVIAVPVSLRIGPGLRDALGPLTAHARVAIDLGDDPSFLTLIGRVSAAHGRACAIAAGLVDGEAVAGEVDAYVHARAGGGTPARAAWRHGRRGEAPAPAPVVALRHGATAIAGVVGAVTSAEDPRPLAEELEALVGELVARPAEPLSRFGAGAVVEVRPDTPRPPPAPEAWPLTHAQDRLWFLEELAPGTTTNHLQRVYRIDGPLDRAALERTLAAIAARHDALRTVFRAVDGAARQLVLPSIELEHAVEDIHPIDVADRERLYVERAAAEYARPFELGAGPLWRTRLCTASSHDHRLIVTIHHLIVDALSILVWQRELAEHYHAFVTGTAPRVPPITLGPASVAVWERSPAGQQRIQRDLAFWVDRLAGATPVELPLDYRRPPAQSLGRHEVNQLIDPELTAEVRAAGRRRGATLNTTLIAAAVAFLSRHTGQDDLVVIVPAARREDPSRRNMIGLLLNLLPLRMRLDGDPTFDEIVARANRAMHQALAHSDAPFERIIAALGFPREPGRHPLFDVILHFVPGAERVRRGDVRFTAERVIGSSQPCDLVIGASAKPGGGLGCTIRCRDDLFAPVTATRMLRRFETLLRGAVAAPHTPLSALPIVPPEERALVIGEWNRTAMDLPEVTVHGLVEAQAARAPEAVAVIQGDRALTSGELDRRANQLARHLQASGVAPGTRVGVAVPPSPELAIAALAAMKAGGVYVPLDAAAPEARRAQLAEQVAVVVTAAMLAAVDPASSAAPLDTPVGADASAYIVFTSGSTGRPKGVATTHRGLVNQILWFRRDLPWRAGEVACMRSSPAFVDSLWELFGPLADGVPVVIATAAEMADPRALVDALARHRVTRIMIVPSLLQTVLELGAPLPDLALWLATSEELKPSLVAAFQKARPGSRLVNLYGASETADQVAAHPVTAVDPVRTPIGRPIANARLYVLGRDGGLQPVGVIGELCASGVGVSTGYLDPAANADKFVADPFTPGATMYRTGDRGRWRHDGVLEYLGRLDHVVKVRGIRIDPGEVEAALLAHPGVAAAAVVARPGFDGENRLAAYVVARAGGELAPGDLRRHLRTRLPETLIPTAFVALAALPLGATGKVDRAALPAPALGAATSRAPGTAVEHAVALAWEQVLGRPVGADDDFFAAGGQSLIAAQLGARLAERFAVELPLPVLFERPTVAAQAAWLEDAARQVPGARIVRAPAGPVPLSFAQERLWFAHALAPDTPAPKLRVAYHLEGDLDAAALEAAMVAVAARHASLRTQFVGDHKSVRQVVAAACPRDHLDADLSGLSGDAQERAIRRHIDDERERPFDLAAGPPWRTRLLRLGERAHVLVLTVHHFVGDGISLQLWLQEVHACYAARLARETPELPALEVQAIDVAAWQRDGTAAVPEPSRRFWRETLAGATALDLPILAPRTAWSTRGGTSRADLAPAHVRALHALARREQCTTFAVMLAATYVLLREAAGTPDVTIGTIAAGRDRPEVRHLIGLFLNPLPLRLAIDGDPALVDVIRQAGRASRAALAHADVPFERIVADVNPERRPYRQPLFDVVLNHHPHAPPLELGALRVAHVQGVGAPVTPYELMIRIIERRSALTVRIDYQRERFADATIQGWLARYVDVLRVMTEDPERRISACG